MCFLSCLYSAVSLTLVREQRFLRIIIINNDGVICYRAWSSLWHQCGRMSRDAMSSAPSTHSRLPGEKPVYLVSICLTPSRPIHSWHPSPTRVWLTPISHPCVVDTHLPPVSGWHPSPNRIWLTPISQQSGWHRSPNIVWFTPISHRCLVHIHLPIPPISHPCLVVTHLPIPPMSGWYPSLTRVWREACVPG